MKLLIITEGYYPYNGGLEKLVTEVAEGLNRFDDYQITVITTSKNDYNEHTENIHDIDVIYLPLNVSHGGLKFAKELLNARNSMKKILKKGFDFVSVQYMGYLATVFSTISSGCKYSISIHGTDVTGQQSKIIKKIQSRIVQHSAVVISNSYYLADALEKKLNCSLQQKLKVIWNGIHLENYKTIEKLTTSNTIVSVGRFVYKKGFDVLIKAFEKVLRQIPDAELIIAGDGIELEKCEQLSEQLGVKDRINFWGQVPNEKISKVFKQGKVFVCPSRNEPFGIVVLEAMAMGIPVIATDSGGVAEIIEDNQYGCIVPIEDPEELAVKIIELLNNDDKCSEFRIKGLERVKDFSIYNVVQRYDEIIREQTDCVDKYI